MAKEELIFLICYQVGGITFTYQLLAATLRSLKIFKKLNILT